MQDPSQPPQPPPLDDALVLTEEESTATTEVPAIGTFYRVDSSRASFGELWRDVRSPLVLIVWITKLLRVKLPGSVNDANVESLEPFLVDESAIPEDIRTRFEPILNELRGDGFAPAVHYAIVDLFHGSRTYYALLTHAGGEACARVAVRTEGTSQKPKVHFYTEFITGFTDNTFLWSTSARSALNPPPGVRLNWKDGASPKQLWTSHTQALAEEKRGHKHVVPLRDEDDAIDLVERHHVLVRDLHLRRKLFTPMTDADLAHAKVLRENFGAAKRGELQHPEVMAELHKLQTKKTNWRSGLLILAVSLVLFIGAGFAQKWEALWLLIPILLFHEFGHYLAMRVFGYRNLQMFFIPFLGAAVSGQNYTAPGWKKVIVALMGPLPGLVVGAALGAAGLWYQRPILINAALFTIILNGFNLLPVLPLDGGRVMHTILFSRHHLLDVTFRVLAAAALGGLGLLAGDKLLMYFGVFMLLGVPVAYKLAKVATDLRRAGLRPTNLTDDQLIPYDVAQSIVARVKAAFPRAATNKALAQHTLHVYETLATRPPGWAASIGFFVLHAASFVLAIVVTAVLVIGQSGSLREFFWAAATRPQLEVDPAAIVSTEGPTLSARVPAPATTRAATSARTTVVATFDKLDAARRAYEEIASEVPAGGTVVLFGQTVLLALPGDDDEARVKWLDLFEARTKDVSVTASLELTCIARSGDEAKAIAEEVNGATRFGRDLPLIPPWHPNDPRTPEQRERHRRARATYDKLQSAGGDAFNDPRMKAIADKIEQASRRGETKRVQKLREEHDAVYAKLRRDALRELAESDDPTIDAEFAKRYVALFEKMKEEEFYKVMTAELSPLMGAAPPDDPYSLRWGFASNSAPIVTFYSLNFHDVTRGAPALVKWLQRRGCATYHYRFTTGGLLGDDEFDLLEGEMDETSNPTTNETNEPL